MGGVSGAFLLLPFQVSVLGFTSPAVSPTNLIFNIEDKISRTNCGAGKAKDTDLEGQQKKGARDAPHRSKERSDESNDQRKRRLNLNPRYWEVH